MEQPGNRHDTCSCKKPSQISDGVEPSTASDTQRILEETFNSQILPLVKAKGHYGRSWLDRRPIYILERIVSKSVRIHSILGEMFEGKMLSSIARDFVKEELLDIATYSLMALARMEHEMYDIQKGETYTFDGFLVGVETKAKYLIAMDQTEERQHE